MNKCIVTTTINPPTEATLRYCQKKDWNVIVVGDTKTPHQAYHDLEKEHQNVLYLSPEVQEKKYKELSDSIGWKSIQRRNVGFVEAYHQGAELVATVDDDNIPYDTWGKAVFVGQEVTVDLYEPHSEVFDPLSITTDNYVWHRGYPIQLLQTRHQVEYKGKTRRKVLVQADLWDGDPDIDAMARLTFKPIVKYSSVTAPYCSNKIAPFNSQNTFLAREVLPYYAVLPHVGRMDDIWGGYILQQHFPQSVIYGPATVYQDRNLQDLVTNLENEIIGYRSTLEFIQKLATYHELLPDKTQRFFSIYQQLFT